MAEDKVEGREINWRHLMPWTVLFRAFRVAASPTKLLLAAAGILVMALGWWLLAIAFSSAYPKPVWEGGRDYLRRFSDVPEEERTKPAWKMFRKELVAWNVFNEAAGDPDNPPMLQAEDLAETATELTKLKQEVNKFEAARKDEALRKDLWTPTQASGKDSDAARQILEKWEYRIKNRTHVNLEEMARELGITKDDDKIKLKAWLIDFRKERNLPKKCGTMRTLPWFEDRGHNPILLLTGQTSIPWEAGHFWDWFLTRQVPVLIEPLVKLLLPLLYFFKTGVGVVGYVYFFLVLLWTLATWALFGGAISRMAAVEVARNEKIGALEALRFVGKRYLSYFLAPLLPLLLLGALLLVMILFGVLHLIPYFGDVVVDGIGWPLMLGVGLIMACVVVGLISWPMMTATISAEDEESLNAAARAYSYIAQAPWHYVWYGAVALVYGALVVFFIGFMGSLTVYLAKWGVRIPAAVVASEREPNFLFVYAPTSFEWRTLLLEGATTPSGTPVVSNGTIDRPAFDEYKAWLGVHNHIGAALVSVWLGALFLIVLGFGYSFFWTASTIIYLLMRKRVDDAELDEVFFEEEDQDEFAAAPTAGPKPSPPPPPPPPPPGQVMVEAPALRIPPQTPPPTTPEPPPAAKELPPPPRPPVDDADLPLKRDEPPT